jgi:hypothetical protein
MILSKNTNHILYSCIIFTITSLPTQKLCSTSTFLRACKKCKKVANYYYYYVGEGVVLHKHTHHVITLIEIELSNLIFQDFGNILLRLKD